MYKEALEDKIRMTKNGMTTIYFPKCGVCGDEIRSLSYIRNVKYKCKRCKEIYREVEREVRKELTLPDKEIKLLSAISRIEAQNNNINEYERPISIVRKFIIEPTYFQSTEEIMTALQLLKDGYKIQHQVKIGKYRADFIIESEKVVLEIDGEKFHNELTKKAEQERDLIILSSLGFDWEVIRVKCKYINENVNALSKYIRKCKEQRKRYRTTYGGKLPKFYNEYGL